MNNMRTFKPVNNMLTSHLWRQGGLSLVELMIAISLGLFLIWGVTQSFLTSRQSYRLQQGVGRIQENGRMAQEFLGFDIRNAGDYGCGSGDDFVWADFDVRNDSSCTENVVSPYGTDGINMITTVNFATNGFEYAVYGFNNDIADNNAITDGTNTINLPVGMVPVAGSDVLVVRLSEELGNLTAKVGTIPPVALKDLTTTDATFNIPNMPVNVDLPAMPADQVVAISDCATTKIFAINAVTAGANAVSLSGANYCAYAGFQQGASVRKLSTVYYFVATSASGNTTSLYRQMGEGALAEELLEGVANMQLKFGLDTNGDSVINDWYDAGAVELDAAAWSGWDYSSDPDGDPLTNDGVKDPDLVRAVRYSLLLVTEDKVLGSDTQSLSYNGATVPADGRLRQVFTSSVGIRSRLNPDYVP